MADNRVVVEYQQRTEREPGKRKHFIGETYVVQDAAAAEIIHPKAKITKYADGRKFVRTQDESLAAVRAAEEAAAAKEAAKAAKNAPSGEKASTTTSTSSGPVSSAQGAKQG